MGKTSAVGLVTWSSIARRVFGVTAQRTAETTSASWLTGNGTFAVTTRAPVRDAT